MRLHAEPWSKDARLSAAEAYTRIAAEYDAAVAGDTWMRRALQAHYARLFLPGQSVLDLGCGTGLDTVFLAQRGIHVLALDASAGMLEQAHRAVAAAGLQALVDVRRFDVADLSRLDVRMDGAISGFAALNTVPDLDTVAVSLHRLVRPGGRVLLHMLNRFSTWEFLGHVAAGQWHAARATGRAPTRDFTIGGQRVLHHVYAPLETYARFAPLGFRLRRAYSLGALRPPHTVRRIPAPVVGCLEWLDLRLGDLPPLRDAGRFFVLDLERRATPA